MRRLCIILITPVVIVVAMMPISVEAQDEIPPEVPTFITVNDQGQITWDLSVLIPVGTVEVPPPEGRFYWPLTIDRLGIDIQLGSMKYSKYVAPDGKYVLIPSGYTAFVLSSTDTHPFDVTPSEAFVNPLIWGPALSGAYEDTVLGLSGDDVLLGLEHSHEVDAYAMRDLVHAMLNPWDPTFNQGNLFFAGGIFIYECDPTDPACAAMITEGTPGPTPPVAPPPGSTCDDPTILQEDILVEGGLLDPPYPIVVGQDQARRGADLIWRVEIPPVVYTWYEVKVTGVEKTCSPAPDGNGGGCPGPGTEYDSVTGGVTWNSSMVGNAEWQVTEEPIIECVEHVEVYPEQLNWVQAFANLSADSRDWIERGELQQRYPGAKLYQPDWEWSPPLVGGLLADGTYVWEFMEEAIQFQDPGNYIMSVQGGTAGTPVTEPRFIDMEAGEFFVWLYEATISQ